MCTHMHPHPLGIVCSRGSARETYQYSHSLIPRTSYFLHDTSSGQLACSLENVKIQNHSLHCWYHFSDRCCWESIARQLWLQHTRLYMVFKWGTGKTWIWGWQPLKLLPYCPRPTGYSAALPHRARIGWVSYWGKRSLDCHCATYLSLAHADGVPLKLSPAHFPSMRNLGGSWWISLMLNIGLSPVNANNIVAIREIKILTMLPSEAELPKLRSSKCSVPKSWSYLLICKRPI